MPEQFSDNMDSALNALENLRMRLLDLTARNRLINFRHTKTASLRIIDELPNQLTELLLDEKELSFLPIPEPTKDELIEAGYIEVDDETGQVIRVKKDPSAEEWAKWKGINTSYEVPESSDGVEDDRHEDNAIQTLLFPYELETRLRGLRQKAESAIEETGANILYLAFGFLEWFDNRDSEKTRLAPLFLVPTRLIKGRLNTLTGTYEYRLSYSGEEIIPNLSLREKLRMDFAQALPELDENTEPEKYFELVKDLIQENQPNWRLHRYVSLALLNFSKLLMYLDLDPDRWPEDNNIINHPVASRFLAGYIGDDEEDGNEDLGFGEEYSIDELPDIHERYPLIDDADSSQHSAVIDAVDGKNLVIEGPPGTGKSQTITILIAAALARGKKVLFVAEKLAALEVVKRRLDMAGLGEFCLELHSHKSQKRKVIEEIGNRLKKVGRYRMPSDIEGDIKRCEELKSVLKQHADLINKPWKKTGKTIHEILMTATRHRELVGVNPEKLHPEGYTGENFNSEIQRKTKDQVLSFGALYNVVANQLDGEAILHNHPWYGVQNTDLQFFDNDRVKSVLLQWQSTLLNVKDSRVYLAEMVGCELNELPETLSELNDFLHDLEGIPELKGDELLDVIHALKGERALTAVDEYIKLFKSIQELYARLSKTINNEVLDDLSFVDELNKGSRALSHLVGEEVEFGTLVEAMLRITKLKEQLEVLVDPIREIKAAIGEGAAKHIGLHEVGLNELRVFAKIISDLQPSYWKLRNDLFDNEEVDDALIQMRGELEALKLLCGELDHVYKVSALPDTRALEGLRSTLEAGGFFRWLKGDWRLARKSLLSYVANPQVKLKTLLSSLETAIVFTKDLQRFEENNSFRDLFGDLVKGLETNLPVLEDIRCWYRNVRKQYGIGFGSKVEIGDALINLPTGLARAIRSLSERGLENQLDLIEGELNALKAIFYPVSELQSGDIELTGESGLLDQLLNSLDEALLNCKPLLNDKELSLSDLVAQIKLLNTLRAGLGKWEKLDLDNKLFNGRLGLKTGFKEDNERSLAIFNNTLNIANCVNKKIVSELISDKIYRDPEAATFEVFSSNAEKLRNIIDEYNKNYSEAEELLKLNWENWTVENGDVVESILSKNDKALESIQMLQNWLDYIRVRDQLSKLGFKNIAICVEGGEFNSDNVENAYYAGVYDYLVREIIHEYPDLGHFSGHTQETYQDQFKKYDEKLKKLQCEKIAWQVDQYPIPAGYHGARVSQHTDRALLEHEISKQTRHIPIRQLVRRAGDALVALKPCFMMGPMSVAQYLKPGQIEFDMVVMDEASQIKPEDALGAITRGAQIVIVGDPKQLPPTSFFDRIRDDDEEDPTAIEESESILDATLPMYKARRLRWHYRSQHESLISFSNHSFYGGDLVIFPSPYSESEEYGVQYSRVRRGCFVNRRNMEEAKIISEAVREHFRHRPDETLGVVAMSAEQRDQIERAVEVLAKEDSVFQSWLETDQSRQESLFVKNLENVQGDERDVIFISMTYGPQEPGGNVYQRFGPINSDVGWRRLNVLFTRSRKRMHVFSSMGSDDIVIGPNSKRGVKALRDFLAFGETGILHHTDGATGRPPDSDFEISVSYALERAGFECVPQVGVAGFFIDLAVIDPGNPGRYLMGIECDGATYHSAKSVRDRDRLRQSILERLGWRIKRIWSTDWFKDPHAELQPIIRELNELKSEAIAAVEVVVESEPDEIEEIIDHIEVDEAIVDEFISREVDLRSMLLEFDSEVIRKEQPDTPENQRLLRPAMLEALVEYMPTSKWEFLEDIPSYLRQNTPSNEGKYLSQVFEIINSKVEENRLGNN